jgi:geranylgeranyl diphosphate synthase type I
MPMSPVDVEDLRQRVHAELAAFLDEQSGAIRDVSGDCSPLVAAIGDLLGGGKRLRPAFCYWGWRAAGGDPASPEAAAVVRAAASLELFQAAALIHDDVMDDSDTRRGQPAAHRRFASLHRENGWSGAPDRFGLAGAVLTGDLCLVWSDMMFTGAGLPAAAFARARVPYDRMRGQLMAGQYLDMLEQALAGSRTEGAVEAARRVIHYKSAKYSIEEPLLIGAAVAGTDDALAAGYSRLGLPVGEAFQLRDDLLGVFGDPAVTGKPAGDDLREGKRTVLVATAMEAAKPEQAQQIRRLLGDPHLDAAGVAALRAVLVETGAREAVEERVDRLSAQARAALAELDVDPVAHEVLSGLIDAATRRST